MLKISTGLPRPSVWSHRKKPRARQQQLHPMTNDFPSMCVSELCVHCLHFMCVGVCLVDLGLFQTAAYAFQLDLKHGLDKNLKPDLAFAVVFQC